MCCQAGCLSPRSLMLCSLHSKSNALPGLSMASQTCDASGCRITFETRSVRDASTVATPASRDASASAAHIAIGQTLVPTHMSKERFGATSAFAASLSKPGGLAELAKLGERLTIP